MPSWSLYLFRSFVSLCGCCVEATRKSVADVSDAIRRLMKSANVVANRPAIEAGLSVLDAGGDFADGVIAYEGDCLGAEEFVSFDSKAISVLRSQGGRARLLRRARHFPGGSWPASPEIRESQPSTLPYREGRLSQGCT
jgi:hypothetical protein